MERIQLKRCLAVDKRKKEGMPSLYYDSSMWNSIDRQKHLNMNGLLELPNNFSHSNRN